MSHSIDKIGKISILEYLVMFFVICISGNPLFIYAETKLLYAFSAALMLVVCIMKRKKLQSPKFILWLCGSILLFIFQILLLKLTSINADINFIARLYIAFLTASFFGYRFREVYLKVMVAICAISIPLYILQLSGISVGYEISRYRSILFYNFMNGDRNPGMFWEPGAFQGFILLVPLLYANKFKELWKGYKAGCIILLLALLTTKSTTAYLTLATFIFLTTLINGKISIGIKGILISFFAVIFVYAWSQDFMGEKIQEEFEDAQTIQQGEVSWSRMGAMLVDIHNIQRHPIIGNGFVDESRYGILGEYMRGAGNGITGAINMFGIPFIVLYLIGVFRNITYIPPKNRMVFLIIIIMLLFGEYFLNYPLFWSLLFIKVPNNETNRSSINRT